MSLTPEARKSLIEIIKADNLESFSQLLANTAVTVNKITITSTASVGGDENPILAVENSLLLQEAAHQGSYSILQHLLTLPTVTNNLAGVKMALRLAAVRGHDGCVMALVTAIKQQCRDDIVKYVDTMRYEFDFLTAKNYTRNTHADIYNFP